MGRDNGGTKGSMGASNCTIPVSKVHNFSASEGGTSPLRRPPKAPMCTQALGIKSGSTPLISRRTSNLKLGNNLGKDLADGTLRWGIIWILLKNRHPWLSTCDMAAILNFGGHFGFWRPFWIVHKALGYNLQLLS